MLAWAVGQLPGAAGYWPCQAVATHALCGVPAVDTATATSFGALFDRRALGPGRTRRARDRGATAVGRDPPRAAGRHGPRELADRGRRWVDRRLLRADRGRGRPARRRAGHLRGHPDRVGGDRGMARGARTHHLPEHGARPVHDRRPEQRRRTVRRLGHGRWRRPDRSRPVEPADARTARGDPGRVPVWLPYLRGERTPFHDPDAPGQPARPRHHPGPAGAWSGPPTRPAGS